VGPRSTHDAPDVSAERAATRAAPTLNEIIGAFKSVTTNRYIEGVYQHGWPRFHKRLWQRDYWDRISRDDIELEQLRSYIRTNPARWDDDALHPDAPPNKFNRWNRS